MRTRTRLRRAALGCLLVALVVAAAPARKPAHGRAAPAPSTAHPPPGPPPAVELGETRPIETALGDPALPAAVDEWIAMIRGARQTLDLEHFYLSWKPGEVLDPVLDELGRAA